VPGLRLTAICVAKTVRLNPPGPLTATAPFRLVGNPVTETARLPVLGLSDSLLPGPLPVPPPVLLAFPPPPQAARTASSATKKIRLTRGLRVVMVFLRQECAGNERKSSNSIESSHPLQQIVPRNRYGGLIRHTHQGRFRIAETALVLSPILPPTGICTASPWCVQSVVAY
jgi:hypothetical protein